MNNLEKNIAPSILNIPKEKRNEVVKEYLSLGIKWIHYDFMDNIFVPNSAIEIGEFNNIIKNNKKHISEAHLMVNTPYEYAQKISENATCLTIHYEVFDENQIINFANTFANENWVGLAIKPKTTFEEIKNIIHYFDVIVIMSVEPGFGGQTFIEESLDKIKMLKKYLQENKLPTLIEVDGGINEKNASLCFEAGANILVCGTYLYNNLSLATIEKLLK
ncbi:MAG: ribulose-phosphate 3-epimerase [Metamycoplasmataceae bacterium]